MKHRQDPRSVWCVDRTSASIALALAILGCDGGGDTVRDGGEADSSILDASIPDASRPDAPPFDAHRSDTTEPPDAPDAGADASDATSCEGPAIARAFLVGDSTVASGSGWGDFLPEYLEGEVTNAARSGRSSKSFYDEGAFDSVRAALDPGDYLLIQFGHNDSKPEADRRTEPGEAPEYMGTFREYLERYIDESRGAGAIPILLTPVSRMLFRSDGTVSRSHGDYALAVRRVAEDNDVTLLDLEEHSHAVFEALGEEETLRRFASEGDRTHFPPEKASGVTEMVALLLSSSNSPLRCALR